MGHYQEAFSLGARDLTFARAGQLAAKRAFQMARIRNPLQELDVAEVYEPFGFQELMWYEALGFCPPGQGAALLEKRVTEMGGRLPVNPSGGALAANPMLATGLVRIIEAAAQVAGRAGKMQVKKRVRRALAAATNGVALQNCAVFVLGGS
jgi:acetyl-CoA C-acetyltransferase